MTERTGSARLAPCPECAAEEGNYCRTANTRAALPVEHSLRPFASVDVMERMILAHRVQDEIAAKAIQKQKEDEAHLREVIEAAVRELFIAKGYLAAGPARDHAQAIHDALANEIGGVDGISHR